MNVTTKLKMDLSKPDFGLSMDAVQGDAYSRSVSIALYNGILPWHIPENVAVAVRYAKPDCTKGYYDTLPDGESAWSYQGNILTVHLTPQMLTIDGDVKAQIELIQDTHILSTFSLTVHVEANPAAGVVKSEDYKNWLQWIREQSDEHVQQVQKSVLDARLFSETASLAAETAVSSASSAKISAQNSLSAAASAETSQKTTTAIAAEVSSIIAGNEAYTKQESNSRYSPILHQTVTGESVDLADSAEVPLRNLKLFGKTVQHGTPTPEAPVPLNSVGESVNVTVSDKNLISFPYQNSNRYTNNGILYTVKENGLIICNGTATAESLFTVKYQMSLKAGTYWLAGCPLESGGQLYLRNDSQSVIVRSKKASAEFTLETDDIVTLWVDIFTGTKVENVIFHPVICKKLQSVTFSAPKDLPGIPVTSGGNYTDENGRQWICDEVDFAEGNYIQRICEKSFSDISTVFLSPGYTNPNGNVFYFGVADNNTVTPHTICETRIVKTDSSPSTLGLGEICFVPNSRGIYNVYIVLEADTTAEALSIVRAEGMKILYVTDTPILYPLPEETLALYATLHTNYSDTTIFNDAGAGMEVKYAADTKLYVDKRFHELAAALVNHV